MACAAGLVLVLMLTRSWIADPLRERRLMQAASALSGRPVHGRLVGLERPSGARVVRGETIRRDEVQVLVTAGQILQESKSPHLRGKALLLRQDTAAAVKQLRTASAEGDAEALSDLAAALLTEAAELGGVEPALDAVVAARRAIVAAPALGAAHFNLALGLERIGLLSEARTAFETAAELEPGTPWASEALTRASAIPHPKNWKTAEALLLATTDGPTRTRLIRQHLEKARRYGEGYYLTLWADATLGGNEPGAAEILEVARVIGAVLRDEPGDRFVDDSVAAIDRAIAGGEEATRSMAKAIAVYRDGRAARGNGDEAGGEKLLAAAAAALLRTGSPLQFAARYYRAGSLYEQGRIKEALTSLGELEAEQLNAKGYRILAAQLEWEHGICLMIQGGHAEALHRFNRGYEAAVAMGQDELAATFDGQAASALEYLGEARAAWTRRARSLRLLALSGNHHGRVVSLTAAALLQIAARNWDRALVLLDYAIPLAIQTNRDIPLAHAYAQRSVARDESGDARGAMDDRSASARAMRSVTDPLVREWLEAELDIAVGVARRVASPDAAERHFTSAIETLRGRELSALLPRVYFERARTHELRGDVARQREDLRSLLDEVAAWETRVRDAEQRAAVGVWSEAARRELITLELGVRDVAAAFSHSDNRDDATAFPGSPSDGTTHVRRRRTLHEIQRTLARDAAILEWVRTGDRMIAFVIRSNGSTAVTLPARAERILSAAEDVRDGSASDSAAAAALHGLLLGPLLRHLEGIHTLAVIPDRGLTGIPFNALRDAEGRFFFQRFAVVVAPSADAAITRSLQIRRAPGASVLAVGASAFDRSGNPGAAELAAVERESREIARRAPLSRTLLGAHATPESVGQELPHTTIAHYGGHIVGRGAEARLLLSPSGGRDSLSAREVAGLNLKETEVVVLAGCRGSRSQSSYAIIGDMASAFLAAGARAVIASTSDIEDATATPTMLLLHDYLQSGDDAVHALRRTALDELHNPDGEALSRRLIVLGGARSLVR